MLKNYNEYVKRIDRERAKKIEQKSLYAIRDEIHEMYENLTLKDKDEIKRIHALSVEREKEYNEINAHNKRILLITKVMSENAKYILADEITPIICDVLQKYKNKAYGEKTKNAIKERLKVLTGCAVYLHSNEIVINVLDKSGFNNGVQIVLYANAEKSVLNIDNRIQALSVDDLTNNYKFTINPPKHVDKMLNEYNKLLKAHKNYMDVLKGFNNYCVGNLQTISTNSTMYNSYLDFYF